MLLRWVCALAAASFAMMGCAPEAAPTGDAARGQVLFENGLGDGLSCQACHCSDATGNCRLGAPDIRGELYAEIDERTRDAGVSHPGGKFSFTTQQVADLAAYLASLAES